MRVTLLPSSISTDFPYQHLTTFVINDAIAVDAGSLGFFGSRNQQSRIRHVFISHTHIDHIASLPIFLENVFESTTDCVTVYGSDTVLKCLREDIFNQRVWPDFIGLSDPKSPFLRLEVLEPGRTIVVEGVSITPVSVDHLVPTLGFILDDSKSIVVIASDTGPTEEIWRLARLAANLKAVFLEVAFPNALDQLAGLTKHLTPALFAAELTKMPPGVRVLAVHLKPRFFAEIASELGTLEMTQVELCRPGECYEL